MPWNKFDKNNIPFGIPVFIKGSLMDGNEIMELVVVESDQCSNGAPGAIPVPFDKPLMCITMDDNDPNELTINELHELILPPPLKT